MNNTDIASLITSNVKAGVWEYRIDHDPNYSSEQALADFIDISAGIANALKETGIGKTLGLGASLTAYLYSYNNLDENDALYGEKVAQLTASAVSIGLTFLSLVRVVPTPQTLALAVAFDALAVLLDVYIVDVEQADRLREENAALQSNIARLKEIQLATIEQLQSESAALLQDFSGIYDPAKKKLDVLRDYEVSAGFGYQLLADLSRNLIEDINDSGAALGGSNPPELFNAFSLDLKTIKPDDVDFGASEAWYGLLLDDSLNVLREIFADYQQRLTNILESIGMDSYGTSGDDTILVLAGGKILGGGEGDDIYVLDGIQGHKYIYDLEGSNRIQIAGNVIGELTKSPGSNGLFYIDEYGNKYTQVPSARGFYFDLVVNIKDGGSVTIVHWSAAPSDFGLRITQKENSEINVPVAPEISPFAYLVKYDGGTDFIDPQGGVHSFYRTWYSNYFTRERYDDVSIFNDKELIFYASDDAWVFDGGNLNDWLVGHETENLLVGMSGDDFIDGGAGYDILIGGDGHDYVLGGSEDDWIFLDGEYEHNQGWGNDYANGGEGDDTIAGGGGHDYIIDEDGNNFILAGVGQDTIISGSGDDRIYGDGYALLGESFSLTIGLGKDFSFKNEYYDDLINAGDGDNKVIGGAGSDYISTGNGDDTIHGDRTVYTDLVDLPLHLHGSDTISAGDGQDYVQGGAGDDLIDGGSGDDTLWGDDDSTDQYFGNDTIYGGAGIDLIHGGAGNDQLYGENDDDRLWAGTGNDLVFGGDGNDSLVGEEGDDTLNGGAGNDSIWGNSGDDVIIGAYGDDYIVSGEGDDVVNGGEGNDSIWAGSGNDYINGGDGNDSLVGNEGNDTIEAGNGNDSISAGHGSDWVSGGSGNDYILDGEDDGNDFLAGGDGNDTIHAGGGHDTLLGGAGNDWLQDWHNSSVDDRNLLNGGAGDDTILSYLGRDTLFGGAGNDHLQSGASDDQLSGDLGNDTLLGQEGNDTLSGGTGDDQLFGGAGDDVYRFQTGDGFDWIVDSSGATTIEFGKGVKYDDLIVYQGYQAFYINYGSDRIAIPSESFYKIDRVQFDDGSVYGLADLLVISGATKRRSAQVASEVISGGFFNGELINSFAWFGGQLLGVNSGLGGVWLDDGRTWFANGAVSLTGPVLYYTDLAGNVLAPVVDEYGILHVPAGAVNEHVLWPDGTTSTLAASSRDGGLSDPGSSLPPVSGSDGDSTGQNEEDQIFYGGSSSDSFSGGVGNDLIRGFDGNDYILGGGDNDLLFGDDGNDTLMGDQGDDLLVGGNGNDFLEGGAGQDTLDGNHGDDHITGGVEDDALTGGAGDDTLVGGQGNDIYYFGLGDGADIIDNSDSSNGYDVLHFLDDIGPDDVLVRRQEDDLILSLLGGSDSVRVLGYFERDAASSKALDKIYFSSFGVFWDTQRLMRMALEGTNQDDEITGYDGSGELIYGGGGNDRLSGKGGDDTLVGGLGGDTLLGGYGNDTYIFRIGDGQDQVIDSEGINTLCFDLGISVEHITGRRLGDDLYLDIAASRDSVKIVNFFKGPVAPISLVQFSDGTVLSVEDLKAMVLIGSNDADTLQGYSGADFIQGRGGDDLLIGGGGSDTYYFELGDGNDTIQNSDSNASGYDRIRFGVGVMPESIELTRLGQDLIIRYSDSDSVAVVNLFDDEGRSSAMSTDMVEFSDGTIWTKQRILAAVLIGGEGDDSIRAYSSNDFLEGKAGADTLWGGLGDDIYRYSSGDGSDVIIEESGNDELLLTDISINQLNFRRDGNDLVLKSNNGEEIRVVGQFKEFSKALSVNGVETIRLADGFTLTGDQIALKITEGTPSGDFISGHPDADLIDAGLGDDLVEGLDGDDTISGGPGMDTLIGGEGNDVLRGGEGDDFLNGDEGDDILYGGEGHDSLNGGTGSDRLFGEGGHDTIQGNGLLDGGDGNDLLEGSGELLGGDGNDTLIGQGFDSLRGGGGDDVLATYSNAWTQGVNTLEGGTGNDTLYGSFGNDIYIFNLGDGHDLLIERRPGEVYSNIEPSTDTLSFGAGIAAGDLGFVRRGNDLIIEHANGSDSITVQNWFQEPTDHFKLEHFLFADGSELSQADVENRVIWQGTSGVDSFIGYRDLDDYIRLGDGDDKAWGRTGNDLIYGEGGNDYLEGEAGNDTLFGGSGNDQLDGGAGDDLLVGGTGDDKYIYAPDGGVDVIDNSGGGYDGVFFTNGIGQDRLTFGRDGDDLMILVDGETAQSVRVLDHFLGGDKAISYVQPSGGYLLTAERIGHIVAAQGVEGDFEALIEGSAGGEQLAGYDGNDLLRGLSGNDTLFGMGGDDQIEGGDGNDYLSGGNGQHNGSGNDLLIGDAGNDILAGEDGDDTLIGGAGDDAYYYRANSGVDIIDNSGGGFDGVFFLDVASSRLSFHREGDDLVILVDSDLGQQVRVINHFLGSDYAIDYVQPDGGNYLTTAQIAARLTALPDGSDGEEPGEPGEPTNPGNPGEPGEPPAAGVGGDDLLVGTPGNDILLGGAGNDTLNGAVGNDTQIGGIGDDTYVYTAGQDVIEEIGGDDALVFAGGITFNQVASGLMKSGDDLILRVNGNTANQVTLKDFFLGGDKLVDTIAFETGGQLTAAQIFGAFGLPVPTPPAAFDDIIQGSIGDDASLDGTAGNDLLQGGNGEDVLFGDAGNDRLEGGNGNDTLNGSVGNDTLLGGRGDDTYIFTSGGGQDVIDNSGGGADTLRFEGISFNQVASGLMKSGNDLILNVSGGSDKVTIRNWFLGGDYVVDNITFASGGQITADQLFGAFGLSNPDPVGSPIYQGLPDERAFGTVLTGRAGDQVVLGSSDDDLIDGGAGNDILRGNAGNDYLIGGAGSDTYVFAVGDGQDVINNLSNTSATDTDVLSIEGIVREDLWLSRNGDDLVIDVTGSENSITIQDWYANPAQQLDVIQAGGSSLYANQVDSLVNAMAAFGAPAGGEINLTPVQRDQLIAVVAANWQ